MQQHLKLVWDSRSHLAEEVSWITGSRDTLIVGLTEVPLHAEVVNSIIRTNETLEHARNITYRDNHFMLIDYYTMFSKRPRSWIFNYSVLLKFSQCKLIFIK